VQFNLTTDNSNFLTVTALIDSGALQDNYVSVDVAGWLLEQEQFLVNCKKPKCNGKSVNLGGTSFNKITLGNVAFHCKFLNEVSKKNEFLTCLNAKILDTNFDLIIGLPTIKKYNLASKFPSIFGETASVPVPCSIGESRCCQHPDALEQALLSMCAPCTKRAVDNDGMPVFKSQKSPKANQQLCIIAALKKKEDLLEFTPDSDEVDWEDNPFDQSGNSGNLSKEELVGKITIGGSESLQQKLRDLCSELSDVFAETIRPEPADVPPMELKVDLEKWQTNKHRGPPRLQSGTKQEEIMKQVSSYLELKVVEPSLAEAYSQVHLVPKPPPPEDRWRFCIDFVRLNACTIGTESWPIPIIAHMIQRVGVENQSILARWI
jgi:hypothetical protein